MKHVCTFPHILSNNDESSSLGPVLEKIQSSVEMGFSCIVKSSCLLWLTHWCILPIQRSMLRPLSMELRPSFEGEFNL